MNSFKNWFIALGVTLLVFGGLYVWLDQSRSIYCLDDGKCVTVWKRAGGKSYIFPYKYRYIMKPKDDYIIASSKGFVDIIWTKNDEILLDSKYPIEIISTTGFIKNYNNNRLRNDSIYTFYDGKYRRYRDVVEFIGIDMEENYATDKAGKKIQ